MALEKALDPALAPRLFGGNAVRRLSLLRTAWAIAVGPELARRTEVFALDAGTLRVRVPDARWRTVLHRMQRDILSRLRDVAGELAPRRLGFAEGLRAEPADPDTPREAREGGAAALPPAIAAEAEAIADPELRRRFMETAARYIARCAALRHD
jgi:hypothetical protein